MADEDYSVVNSKLHLCFARASLNTTGVSGLRPDNKVVASSSMLLPSGAIPPLRGQDSSCERSSGPHPRGVQERTPEECREPAPAGFTPAPPWGSGKDRTVSRQHSCCWVKNLMIDLPNFAENASFVSLLKLSQTNKEMRERLLPILKAKRLQELKSLQTWLSTLNRNYTLEKLTLLEELFIVKNQITVIPPGIGLLTHLEGLSLSHNKITKIPPEIGQLVGLEVLDLGENQITTIPPEIGQLTHLKVLCLDSNKITEIPPEIGQLTNLTHLWLGGNQITEIPPEIGILTHLKELYLNNNQITEIPPNLKRPGLDILI